MNFGHVGGCSGVFKIELFKIYFSFAHVGWLTIVAYSVLYVCIVYSAMIQLFLLWACVVVSNLT